MCALRRLLLRNGRRLVPSSLPLHKFNGRSRSFRIATRRVWQHSSSPLLGRRSSSVLMSGNAINPHSYIASLRFFSSNNAAGSPPPPPPPAGSPSDPRLHVIFTCKTCETRVAKSMSKLAYEKGVVIIRCPGCENLHLMADHLGYFGRNRRNIEDIIAQQGEGQQVKRVGDSTWEIRPEDIAGKPIGKPLPNK